MLIYLGNDDISIRLTYFFGRSKKAFESGYCLFNHESNDVTEEAPALSSALDWKTTRTTEAINTIRKPPYVQTTINIIRAGRGGTERLGDSAHEQAYLQVILSEPSRRLPTANIKLSPNLPSAYA